MFTKAQRFNQLCAPDNCKERQKINKDGTCETCPEYTRVADNGFFCIDECGTERQGWETPRPNQVLDKDGQCHDECPDYSYKHPTQRICIRDDCDTTEMLFTNGKCLKCPEYTKSAKYG